MFWKSTLRQMSIIIVMTDVHDNGDIFLFFGFFEATSIKSLEKCLHVYITRLQETYRGSSTKTATIWRRKCFASFRCEFKQLFTDSFKRTDQCGGWGWSDSEYNGIERKASMNGDTLAFCPDASTGAVMLEQSAGLWRTLLILWNQGIRGRFFIGHWEWQLVISQRFCLRSSVLISCLFF